VCVVCHRVVVVCVYFVYVQFCVPVCVLSACSIFVRVWRTGACVICKRVVLVVIWHAVCVLCVSVCIACVVNMCSMCVVCVFIVCAYVCVCL